MTVAIPYARCDAADCLIEADPTIEAINARAGGATGAPLGVPQLATIVRLTRRLAIPVARTVTIADDDHDLELWVRAVPDSAPNTGGVRLSVSQLRERPAWRPVATPAANRDFLLSGADWTWETDAALRLTEVTPEAGPRHGFDVAAVLGQPVTRLFALADGEAGALPMMEALAARRDLADQPAVIRASSRPVRLSAVARLDSHGGFSGFHGAVRMVEGDAPDAEPLPAGLPPVFSGRLDKALRGPLGRIIANADSISAAADGPVGPDYAGYAADIANAGRHLIGLVDDLVDLDAIERPDFVVEDEAIDLADLARRAAGLLAVRAGEAAVQIDRPRGGETMPARGEFRRALQVLVNLIGNAVRYSPRGATVWVRVQRDGDRAAVIVADRGRGIAPDHQAMIFDKFGRVDSTEPGGNGLGLYIARRLARAMGGDLTVDSAPGAGARFVFWLPAE